MRLHEITCRVLLLLALFMSCWIGATYAAPSDYVLPGFENARDPALREWRDKKPEYLAARSESWIRTLGEYQLALMQFRGAKEPEQHDIAINRAIDQVFSRAASDLRSLFVLARICAMRREPGRCEELNVYERIISLDGENLAAYLPQLRGLQWPYSGPIEQMAGELDSPTVRKRIIGASSASRYRRYPDLFLGEYHAVMLAFVDAYPSPSPEQRQNPDYLLAFDLSQIDIEWMGGTDPFDVIGLLCRYYRENLDEYHLKSACDDLVPLLKSSHVQLGYSMEANVMWRRDPFDPRALHLSRLNTAFAKVAQCLRPHWLHLKRRWADVSESDFDKYLSDLAEFGSWVAMRNASIRDYAAYPSLYQQDPAECAQVLTRDSEQLGAFLGPNDPAEDLVKRRERIRLIESFAAHTEEDREMELEIDRLDHIEDVYDPLVEHMASHGRATVPFLLARFCSYDKVTTIAAARILGEVGELDELFPLMEMLVKARETRAECDSRGAIRSIAKKQIEKLEKNGNEHWESELQELAIQNYCTENWSDINRGKRVSMSEPLVVLSRQFSMTATRDCKGMPATLVPQDQWEADGSVMEEGITYRWIKADFLPLPAWPHLLPEFVDFYGSMPETLALVRDARRGSGDYEIWVKVDAGWRYFATTSSWVY